MIRPIRGHRRKEKKHMFKNNREVDMISGPIFKNIIIYAFPLMLSGILQLFYNAADIIVIGRFSGQESLAAVGSTGAIINLIVNAFLSLSVGVSVTVAQGIGARDNKMVSDTVHTAITVALISGVLISIVGLNVTYAALRAMGTTADVIDKAALYMKIIFLGTPASIVYNFGASIIIATGDTKRPLYFLSIAGFVNVLLNLLFVIVFKMDVAGVAIPTIIAQYISAFFVVSSLWKGNDIIKLNLRELRINGKALIKITKIGVPACIQSIAFAFSNVMIQSAVNSFGSSVIVAGNTASANLEGFIYTSTNSFYQASMTFTGQNVGAKNYDRIGKILRSCMIWVLIAGAFIGSFVFIFGEQLLGIYAPGNTDVIAIGLIRLTMLVPLYFLCGEMEVVSGSLRGMGSSLTPMIVSVLGACGIRILWILTIFQKYHDLKVLYISLPVSWFITMSVHLICWVIVKRNLVSKGQTAR